mgnify:CR=1 FL=1
MMRFTIKMYFMILCTVWAESSYAMNTITVALSQHTLDGGRDYYTELLKLSLEETIKTHGLYNLRFLNFPVERQRLRKLLISGEVDILWSSSTPERERSLLPIYFDLNKGLTGYRVLMIRKSSLKSFTNLNTFSAFQELVAGSGVNWSTTKLLKSNNIQVVTGATHESLFKMLAKGRFDYVLRGIQEIHSTNDLIEWFKLSQSLEVYDKLIIDSPTPFYFFLAPNNLALAERIGVGLELLKTNGKFDKLFSSFESNKRALNLLNLSETRVIKLVTIEPRAEQIYQPISR